ncbi:ABC transporter substrate-binding protein [Aquibium sp. A9E412]|uniref:ABC transporter substrate-binding protein n=1 Tax=Aquibium sp. A9E412 TaxID=2976767 RepID=UPI0025AF26EF|nr:ABC transporter substrate-binding protein [Aquibium sp. A9E412]MDN2565079.1 ABC transporter substrate-binding protein [Aquibium sp. A9E412]
MSVALVALAAPVSPLFAEAHAASVTIGSEGAIPPLDPHRTNGTVGLRVIDAVYDGLVREDLSKASDTAPEIVPALASDWSVSEDGLTYTFTIRDGVTFHDGTPLDAAAVQTNFDRLMNEQAAVFDERASGNMSFLTRWIDGTEATDAMTFVIRLKEPFSGLPRLLSDRRMSIVSPAALEANPGDELGFNPVGTGPFQLDTFAQGQTLELTRNDGYWRAVPEIEELVFRPITDPTALAIAMQTGEIDVIPSASAEQVAQLSGQPGLAVQYPDPANAYFIRLNTQVAPTDDKTFRQALNYAVNREAIAALFGGQAAPAASPVPRGNEIAEEAGEAIAGYSYDPEKAKALIAEAGIDTPVTLNILSPNSGPGFGLATQLITLVQQDLKAVGVQIDPEYLEFSTLLSTERGGYPDAYHGSYNGWTTGADSAYWLERMFSGAQQPPNGVNRGWYENEAVDEAFRQARQETDAARRTELYVEAAEKITADAPWIFLYQDRLPRIVRDSVNGIEPAGSVYIDYARLSVE